MKFSVLRKLFPLALAVGVALACNLARNLKRAVDEAQEPTTLTSADGRVQLTLPGGWREDRELNESAALQASNRLQEMYVVVISESKEDFAEGMTLADFAGLSRTATMGSVASARATDPVPAKVGGHTALEYQLEGTVEGVNVKYLCTVVETPTTFHQIITWTLPSRFDQNQAALRKVTESFKELGAAAPSGVPPPSAEEEEPPPPAPPGRTTNKR